jgi:hypothetical protein
MTAYDVASNICEALREGEGGGGEVDDDDNRFKPRKLVLTADQGAGVFQIKAPRLSDEIIGNTSDDSGAGSREGSGSGSGEGDGSGSGGGGSDTLVNHWQGLTFVHVSTPPGPFYSLTD